MTTVIKPYPSRKSLDNEIWHSSGDSVPKFLERSLTVKDRWQMSLCENFTKLQEVAKL